MASDNEKKHDKKEDETIYEKYRAKYSLPEFNKVQKFLQLSDLEDDGLLLITIKKKLVDKLGNYAGVLDTVVNPDASINSIYESSFFTEAEKNSIFKLFKRITVLERYADLTMLDESDESNAEFIRAFFEAHPAIKKEIEKILTRQRDSLGKEDVVKIDKIGYMG